MKKYMFVNDGVIEGCGELPQLTEFILNVEVSDEVYNNFISDRNRYIYRSGEIIENPQYQIIKKEQEKIKEVNILKEKLENIDKKRIRALCENDVKDSLTGQTWLGFYNKEALNIRNRIAELSE